MRKLSILSIYGLMVLNGIQLGHAGSSQLEKINREFVQLVNEARPAVVQITTTKEVKVGRSSDRPEWIFPFGFDSEQFGDQFHKFFRRPHDNQNPEGTEKRKVPSGLGSGVLVSSDGYILTNNHVIESADDIMVVLSDHREYEATVVGKDAGSQGTDLAVLKIKGKNLPYLEFGDSGQLQVGEWAIAIGSPFGLEQSVTRGIVSAKGRSTSDVNVASYADFIQTDAAINRGNSGGALLNIRGQLVGINTAIATGGNFSKGNVGVGFSIPSNLARRVMTQLIEKGEVERGWLGIRFQEVDHNLAKKLKLGEPKGALVTMVGAKSPADKGGLKRGDLIIEFDNLEIEDGNHLRNAVAAIEVGKVVTVKVLRKNSEKVLKIKIAKRTEKAMGALATGRSFEGGDESELMPGVRVSDLTEALINRYKIDQNSVGVVVVAVDRSSSAFEGGLRNGDLIQELDREEIKNIDDYVKTLKKLKKSELEIMLYVRHADGSPEYLTINIGEK